jgi:hypothetical protein
MFGKLNLVGGMGWSCISEGILASAYRFTAVKFLGKWSLGRPEIILNSKKHSWEISLQVGCDGHYWLRIISNGEIYYYRFKS